jgi:hypothetical protein
MSKQADMARWRQAEAERRKYVNLARRDVARYIRTARKAASVAARASLTTDQALANAVQATSQPKVITKMLVDIWTRTGKHFARQTRDTIAAQKKEMEWFEVVDYWVQLVQSLVTSQFVEKIVGIDQTSMDAIKKFVSDGIEEGWSISDIADNIASGHIPNMDTARATRIARTETIGASNAGSLEGAKSMGITGLKKFWIVALDGRERKEHRDVSIATSESPIGIDDYFNVGGSNMQYPGDPNGDVGMVVNCRCAIGYETPLFGRR